MNIAVLGNPVKLRGTLVALLLLAATGRPACAALAETPLFERFDTADGLPSSTVYETALDRRGFLWIATADGLARYDGVSFRSYRPDPRDPDALPASSVQTLLVDRDDRLWLGIEDAGLAVFDASRRRLRRYAHDEQDPASVPTNDIWALAQDPAGAIWIGTYAEGLLRLWPDTARYERYRHADADGARLPADDVTCLRLDRSGWLWVGTTRGALALQVGGLLEGARPTRVASLLDAKFVTAIGEDASGRILIGARDGLYTTRHGPDGMPDPPWPVEMPEARPVVEGFADDGRGGVWIAARRGLFRLDAGGRVVRYRADRALPFALATDGLTDLQRDREGGLWVSGLGGLAHLKPNWRNFSLFQPRDAPLTRAGANGISALAACPDGGAWLLTGGGGVARFDPAGTGEFALHLATPEQRAALPSTSFFSGACQRDALWIGHRAGVMRYEPSTGGLKHWLGDGPGATLLAGFVNLLLDDGRRGVWAASDGGGLEHIDASGTVTLYPGGSAQLESTEFEQISFDPEGTLWAAGNRGLARLRDGSFVPLAHARGERVHAFAFASDGTLWMHRSGQLSRLQRQGDEWVLRGQYGAAEGIEVERLGGLNVSADGAVWLSGPRGLRRLEPGSGTLAHYGAGQGLPALELGSRPASAGADGTLLLTSSLGVLAFDPLRLEDVPLAPELVLDRATVRRGGDAEPVAWPESGPLRLGWRERDLDVAVRALALTAPAANRYRFRLAGFESDWVDTGARAERSFSALPAGHYTLEIAASNASGVWTRAPLRLELALAPPPWRTAWAYAAYALALLGLLALGARAYRERVKRRFVLALAEERRRAAERANEAKSALLADIGHDIRAPMTGLLGMSELLLGTPLEPRQREYAETVLAAARHLLGLVNDLLDLSRMEAGRLALEPEAFDPRALLEEVVRVQRPLAAARGLALELSVDPHVPAVLVGDARRVRQILLNLANNAVKFTEAGRVTLALANADGAAGVVRFSVVDTGPGMGPETRARLFTRFQPGRGHAGAGSGLGLSICKRLAEAMGGDIAVESEPGRGTTFHVRLPLPAPADATGAAEASEPAVVLVVDRDEATRSALAATLRALGHRVHAVAQALDALAALASRRYDVALFDLELPAVDGIELLRLVRAEAGWGRTLPVLALSVHPEPGMAARCAAHGFQGLVRKSCGAAELAAALEPLLAGLSPEPLPAPGPLPEAAT